MATWPSKVLIIRTSKPGRMLFDNSHVPVGESRKDQQTILISIIAIIDIISWSGVVVVYARAIYWGYIGTMEKKMETTIIFQTSLLVYTP